jgi:O-antigen ligase
VVVLFFCVVLYMTSPGLLGVFRSLFAYFGSDTSVSTRTADYGAVASVIRDSPWIGRGPGTFLPKYRILDNQWLMTLIDSGILGAIGIAIYFLTPGYLGWGVRRASRDELDRWLGQSLIGMSFVIIWAGTTFDFFSFPMGAAMLALYLGIAGALHGVTAGEAAQLNAPRRTGYAANAPA